MGPRKTQYPGDGIRRTTALRGFQGADIELRSVRFPTLVQV